ncbi:hypothetical protein [Micromonospora sp. HK10]|uniref:hypothetical protein n=1 Tax=Micromonospora sp. HK10 TaxID=1538294 RepID=UPI000627087A|nr:hypothetical protein [Micromonospora sp. HK10]KKK04248.1 hypothetical protein LQ51_19430 [Micromonospora sp. HK10]
MSLPAVAPDVAADAVAALPGRLRAKLDQAIEKVPGWPVTTTADGVLVTVDEQVTVTLTAPVEVADRAVCSCLLAPRCLHRTAVLAAAPVLDPSAEPPAVADGPASAVADGPASAVIDGSASAVADGPASAVADGSASAVADGPAPGVTSAEPVAEGLGPEPVGAAELAAVELMAEAVAGLLAHGLPGAGAVLQADLLRAVHQARAAGLPRLAAAGTRIVAQVRAARRSAPDFRLAELADDVREALLVCHLLRGGPGDPAAARGVARRGYHPVGELRLYGLCVEPLRTRTGHVGAVTYLVDEQGTVWSVAQARPGGWDGAGHPANAPVDLGEARLSLRELGRSGILAADAYASADRRLGHGRAVRAVRTEGRGWWAEPAAGLWRKPPAAQAARWLAAGQAPVHERPAGHDLAFLDGVLGADRRGLLLHGPCGAGPVLVLAPQDDPVLPYVANLRALAAHAAGRPVRLVGRFAGPRRVHGLALAADWLPQRHGGHVDLGVDRLQRADLPGAGPAVSAPPEPARPPLHLVTHQLRRVVAAGRASLIPDLDRDLRALRDAQLPTAAAALAALRRAGQGRARDAFGRLGGADPAALATAWLTAACYASSASAAATATAWL